MFEDLQENICTAIKDISRSDIKKLRRGAVKNARIISIDSSSRNEAIAELKRIQCKSLAGTIFYNECLEAEVRRRNGIYFPQIMVDEIIKNKGSHPVGRQKSNKR